MKKYLSVILDFYGKNNLIIESLIFSFILIYIDVFNFITLLLNNKCIYLMILFLIFIFIKLINKNNLSMLYSKNINIVDKYIILISCIMLIYFIYASFFDYKLYKLIILYVIFFVDLYIIDLRKNNIRINSNNENISVYDLKYICNNKVELSNEKGILLLEEKDVDYDLLNRKNIINQLYNSIINCMPRDNFTIGLNGKWGSGKTTVINNVLRLIKENEKDDDFLIVRFDPWKYDDEKTILKGFLTEILCEMHFDFNTNNINSLVTELINTIFENKSLSLGHFFYREINNLNDDIKIEKIVNNYLKANNKRLLLIIDNLDRIDGQKALFLIKCIETITKFKRSIYVLLYDEDILDKSFKKIFKSNRKYMEKIVQLKINMPETDYDTLNYLKQKIASNILINGEPFIDFVNETNHKFNSIRELKRFINSVLSSNVNFSSILNRKDEASLEYIKATNIDLYYEIWNHKNYFISFDRKYDPTIYTINLDGLNKSTKEYFDNLFSIKETKEYKEILSYMFPSVKNYFEKINSLHTYTTQEEYKKSVLENRISNTRYFDLYFTGEENDFTRLNNDINKVILNINQKKYFYLEFEKKLSKYCEEELKVFSELLQLNIDKVDRNKYIDLILVLLNLYTYSNNKPQFFEINVISRINIIIAEMLSKITTEEFETILEKINKDYKNLSHFSEIKRYIEQNQKKNIKYNIDFNEFYNNMCKSIFDNKINLFSERYYCRSNIWSLYNYNATKTKKYLSKVLNDNNIYKFISDLISISVGTKGYGYSINKENIQLLASNIDIDKLLHNKNKKLSDKDKFIKSVYDLSKETTNKLENEIYSKEYIDINY